MKYIRLLLITAIALIGSALIAEQEAPSEPIDKSRMYEYMAIHKYSDLNEELGNKLTQAFEHLGDTGSFRSTYFDKHRHPETHAAHLDFLVQVFDDQMNGVDVVEAMFAEYILEITPPHVVFEALIPYIGKRQKLENILGTKHLRSSSIACFLQRQSDYSARTPDFRIYANYIDAGCRGIGSSKNNDALASHMLWVDPQEAFKNLLQLPMGTGYKVELDTAKRRALQIMQLDIIDYLSRRRYSSPIADGALEKVTNHLQLLAEHETWWLRQYAALVLTQKFGVPNKSIIGSLRDDPNPYVREVIEIYDTTDPRMR